MESKTLEISAWRGEMSKQLLTDTFFCDIVLQSNEGKIPAHRIILASACDFFRAMLTSDLIESKSHTVKIDGVEGTALKELVRYCYTGNITITSETVHNLLEGSNYLQLLWVRDECEKYLAEHVGRYNLIQLHAFAEQMNCKKLIEACESYLSDRFSEITRTEQFLSWSSDILLQLLQRDDLCVDGEEEVYEACLKWVHHDKDNREKHFEKIFASLRIHDIHVKYVVDQIDNEQMVLKSVKCMKTLMESKNFHLLHSGREFIPSRSCKEVLVFGRKKESNFLSFKVYNLSRQKWTNYEVDFIDPRPEMWSFCKVVPWGNKIFILDRGYPSIGPNFWIYDFERLKSMYIPYNLNNGYGFDICEVENSLYFFPGVSATWPFHNRIISFCMESEHWDEIGTTDENVCYGEAVQMNDFVYKMGGLIPERSPLDGVQKYDIKSKRWTHANRMIRKRAFQAACCLKGKIYVAGGLDPYKQSMRSVEVYDPETDKWKLVEPMNLERKEFGLIPIMNKLWAIGGSGYKSERCIEIYDPVYDKWTFGPEMTEPMDIYGCCDITGKRIKRPYQTKSMNCNIS